MSIGFLGAAIGTAGVVWLLRSKILRTLIAAIMASAAGQILADLFTRGGLGAFTHQPSDFYLDLISNHADVLDGTVAGATSALLLLIGLRWR